MAPKKLSNRPSASRGRVAKRQRAMKKPSHCSGHASPKRISNAKSSTEKMRTLRVESKRSQKLRRDRNVRHREKKAVEDGLKYCPRLAETESLTIAYSARATAHRAEATCEQVLRECKANRVFMEHASAEASHASKIAWEAHAMCKQNAKAIDHHTERLNTDDRLRGFESPTSRPSSG